MKIIFAGTPEFSVPTLQALIDSKHQVVAVYTQPDRPAGRGRKLTASPVKQCAQQHGIEIQQPKTLRDAAAQKLLAAKQADVMVVVAYGLILPKTILQTPRYGCLNVHASLLPKYRGASPIQAAILAGESQTGVTIMQMDEGLDTGDILATAACEIHEQDTAAVLHDKLSQLGATTLLPVLQQIEQHSLQPIPQDNALATSTHKINKQDACIDWQQSSKQIINLIRAYNPWPIAFTRFNDQNLRIYQAEKIDRTTQQLPGTIISVDKGQLEVATGDGAIRILELQLPGGRPIKASAFLNANLLTVKQSRLGDSPS